MTFLNFISLSWMLRLFDYFDVDVVFFQVVWD